MANQMTPFLRPLRDNSGTIYVFPSAVEDIGLNLDIKDNKVALSKYVVLNLPETDTSFSVDHNEVDSSCNHFNFTNISGLANLFNNNTSLTPREKIACALQNYMMNMETTIVNQEDYDYALSKTVSERVFWKFLKETGAIRWVPVDENVATLNGEKLYREEAEGTGYKRVVQSIGQISAGNSITNDFGLYNETYVNIPSTYGGSEVYFRVREDNNYRLGEVYTSDSGDYLAGRNSAMSEGGYLVQVPVYDFQSDSKSNDRVSDILTKVENSGMPWYQYTDQSNTVENSYFTENMIGEDDVIGMNYKMEVYDEHDNLVRSFYRSRLDGVEVVTDIDEIDKIYDQVYPGHGFISYDTINIDTDLIHTAKYDFNAILLYYSMYDRETGAELATNLFGILFLSSPDVKTMTNNSGENLQFVLPTYEKTKSNGAGSSAFFGTGYSFKINIRSLSVYDNTDALIFDNTTTTPMYTEDFNEVIYDLNTSVDLLKKNSQILGSVFNSYKGIVTNLENLQYAVKKTDEKLNEMNLKKFKDIDSSNINTYDFQCNHKAEFSGTFKTTENVDFDIPMLDVSMFKANKIETEDISVGYINARELSHIDNSQIKKLDVSILAVNGDGIFCVDSNQYLNVNSDIFKEVIEATKYIYNEDGTTYIDSAVDILKKTEIIAVNDRIELMPSSVADLAQTDQYVSNLYNVDNGKGYINYMGYIPILVGAFHDISTRLDDMQKSINALSELIYGPEDGSSEDDGSDNDFKIE